MLKRDEDVGERLPVGVVAVDAEAFDGHEWQHLTRSDVNYLVEVWSDWNVVVDNDHINASVPPEGSTNRVAVLNCQPSPKIVSSGVNRIRVPRRFGSLPASCIGPRAVPFENDCV